MTMLTKDQVADLIEQIPQGLTPDEFLVALANDAAELERQACTQICAEFPDHVAQVIRERIEERGQA